MWISAAEGKGGKKKTCTIYYTSSLYMEDIYQVHNVAVSKASSIFLTSVYADKKKVAHVNTWNGTVVEYHPQESFVIIRYVSE
jgi:hypothetical protein